MPKLLRGNHFVQLQLITEQPDLLARLESRHADVQELWQRIASSRLQFPHVPTFSYTVKSAFSEIISSGLQRLELGASSSARLQVQFWGCRDY